MKETKRKYKRRLQFQIQYELSDLDPVETNQGQIQRNTKEHKGNTRKKKQRETTKQRQSSGGQELDKKKQKTRAEVST